MKWLLVFFTVLKPLLSSAREGGHKSLNPINDIKDMIKENAVKVVSVFAFSSVLSTLFSSGIIIIAINLSNQYDLNNVIVFNSMIGTGIGLIFVSLLIGYLIVRSYKGENQHKISETAKEVSLSAQHPLQDSVVLLVNDFIKEREFKREYRKTSQEPSKSILSDQYENEIQRH